MIAPVMTLDKKTVRPVNHSMKKEMMDVMNLKELAAVIQVDINSVVKLILQSLLVN
jgi:hypothetical protein